MSGSELFQAQLDVVLATNQSLPALPAVVLKVQRALADERGGMAELARLVDQDPALATRLLQMANSAAFAGGSRATSVGVAIDRLGLARVRSLFMTVGMVKAFKGVGQQLDHERYWRHSAAVGLVTEWLAKRCFQDANIDAGQAYMTGLLHDVGLLILDQFFPAIFAETKRETDAAMSGRWHVERDQIGMDHGQLGGRFLLRWQLDPAVVDAVSCHHHPVEEPGAGRLSQLVWAAEALCSAGGLELPDEGLAEIAPDDVLTRLGAGSDDKALFLAEVGRIGEQALMLTA